MRKASALAVFLCVFATSAWAVGEARITGKIVDADGKALAAAEIQVEAATTAKTFNETYKSDKNGRFTIFLLDGTIPYKFTFKSEGLPSFEETIKLQLLPNRNERTITLTRAAAPVEGEGQPAADPAVLAYNEGADLANQGKSAEAIAKIEEAVAAKPDMTAGWLALAKLYFRADNWPKAIVAANNVLAISSDEQEMFVILAEAYEKTGEKAKAKEFRDKGPVNPAALFNDAARLINGGDDAGAEPLLKKAIAADATFAPAHYELGMIYARTGKNADARQALLKYIELDPQGKDVALAQQMLEYVK